MWDWHSTFTTFPLWCQCTSGLWAMWFDISVPQCLHVTICVRALCFPCNLPHVLSKWRSHSCSDCNHSMANMVRALLWITRVSRQSRRLQEPSAVVKEQHYMNDYSHCNRQQVCVFKFVVHLAFVWVFLSVDIELSNHYIWPLWGPILNTALLFLIVRTWQQSKTEKRLNNTKYQQLSITSFASWGKSCFLSTVTDGEKTKKKKVNIWNMPPAQSLLIK